MLTQCPSCETIYQISAGELSAAKGFVECGDCGAQFNALDTIADEPLFDTRLPEPESVAAQDIKPAPTFVLMEDGDPVADGITDANSTPENMPSRAAERQLETEIDVTDELDKTLELAVIAEDAPLADTLSDSDSIVAVSRADSASTAETDSSPASLPTEEHEILFSDISSEAPTEPVESPAAAKVIAETEIDLDEVPPILQEELLAMREPRKSSAGILWGASAVLLLLGLGIQTAWRYKDSLLEQFPNALPYAERVCALAGCELDSGTPFEPIQLVSRDVRTHPRYENSLLVNASMVNSGEETIAFPTVQLGLFDPTGTAIGIRQFSPPEYLDKSIDIDNGIPAGRSVHVVLELANTGDTASSFEFSFH